MKELNRRDFCKSAQAAGVSAGFRPDIFAGDAIAAFPEDASAMAFKNCKIVRGSKLVAFCATALCVSMSPLAVSAADMTVETPITLTGPIMCDKLTVKSGKTLDLAGHSLTCTSIADNDGYIIDSGAIYTATVPHDASDDQYIQCSGNFWINTGIIPECTDTIEMKTHVLSSKNDVMLWFAATAGYENPMNCYVGSGNDWKLYFNRNGTVVSNGATEEKNSIFTISANFATGSYSVTKNGKTTTCATTELGEYTVGGPLVLFARNSDTRYPANHERSNGGMHKYYCAGTNGDVPGVKLFYFRVKKNDGTYRCNFVPARIANSGVAGLYDTVSGQFVTRELMSQGEIDGWGEDVYVVERASGGELHLNLAADATITKMRFGGGVKIVKEGAKTLTMSPSGPYMAGNFGGIEVAAGTLKPGVAGTNQVFGIRGGEVVVDSGATLDMNDQTAFGDARITLNGGTIQQQKTAGAYNNILSTTDVVKHLRLKADSTFAVNTSTFGIWNVDEDPATLDLNGKTLTVDGSSYWARPVFSGLYASSEGTIHAAAGSRGLIFYGTDSDLSKATIVAETNIRVQDGVTLTVGGYVCNATANTDSAATGSWDNGKGAIKVIGTFAPNTDYYHGCELQDGATLDLSERATPMPLESPSVSPRAADCQYKVSFADGATIRIALDERAVPANKPLVSWTTAPDNLSTLDFVSGDADASRRFVIKEDGVYPAPSGFAIVIK